MRVVSVCFLMFLCTLNLNADDTPSYNEMRARLDHELSRLSQEPGKSLLALDELKQIPNFKKHSDLMIRLLEAYCFSLMNLGRFAESASTADEGLTVLTAKRGGSKSSRL